MKSRKGRGRENRTWRGGGEGSEDDDGEKEMGWKSKRWGEYNGWRGREVGREGRRREIEGGVRGSKGEEGRRESRKKERRGGGEGRRGEERGEGGIGRERVEKGEREERKEAKGKR